MIVVRLSLAVGLIVAGYSPSAHSRDDLHAVNQRVSALYRAGKYLEALPIAERAARAAKERESTTHSTAFNNLGLLYRAQGRYAQAEIALKRSLEMREKLLGSDHVAVAESLQNLAALRRDQGSASIADENLILHALAIREKTFGPRHANVAASLNLLAMYNLDRGEHSAARSLFDRALSIRSETLGVNHEDVGETTNDIGLLQHVMGNYAEAETTLKRGLAIREKSLGLLHPDVGESLFNIAQLFLAQDRNAEAATALTRALAIQERSIGPEQPALVNGINKLAKAKRSLGRHSESMLLHERVFKIKEKPLREALSKAEPISGDGLVEALQNLAKLNRAHGRYEEAVRLLSRAAKVREKTSGIDEPGAAEILQVLADTHLNLGDYGAAERALKRALQLREIVLSKSDDCNASRMPAVRTLWALVILHRSAGHFSKSEQYQKRADELSCIAFSITSTEGSYAVMPVLFGTDRKCALRDRSGFQDPPNLRLGCDAERSEEITFGRAYVTVPRKHSTGTIERPAFHHIVKNWFSREEDAETHFTIARIEQLDTAAFVEAVQHEVTDSSLYRDQALVYVHGYAVSFDNALYRAAQIAYDIKFDGGLFVYSWPSGGGLSDYLYDEESARFSEPHLQRFLELVLSQPGVKRVRIVAHSMGSAPLLRTLASITRSIRPVVGLDEVILAAPDIDRAEFEKLAQAIVGTNHVASAKLNLTLYVSARDKALAAARQLRRGKSRAGEISSAGPVILAGVDTIDVSAIKAEFWNFNHSTYADSPEVLADIRALLLNRERPPKARTPNLTVHQTRGGVYWAFPK